LHHRERQARLPPRRARTRRADCLCHHRGWRRRQPYAPARRGRRPGMIGKPHPTTRRRIGNTGGETMFEILGLLVAGGAAVGGYIKTRSFVARRLRYVDSVQKSAAPWIAGTVAGAAVLPFTVLPLIGAGTVLAVGAAVGAGTAAGARAIGEG